MPTKIEWCDETINPLGYGCYGTGTKEKPEICPYCYAHKLARRGMRDCELCKQFIPHTHFEQLDKLKQWKKSKTVFVQSMGDLFHDDIPDEWIDDILLACRLNPQHRYLFLTKNGKRYKKFMDHHVDNIWFGQTVTGDEPEGEKAFYAGYNTFLSIEPLLRKIEIMDMCKHYRWVIIGAETGNRKDKVIPKREWIENIVEVCRVAKVPVFMKNNLVSVWGEPLIQEYPW